VAPPSTCRGLIEGDLNGRQGGEGKMGPWLVWLWRLARSPKFIKWLALELGPGALGTFRAWVTRLRNREVAIDEADQIDGRFSGAIIDGERHLVVWKGGEPVSAYPPIEGDLREKLREHTREGLKHPDDLPTRRARRWVAHHVPRPGQRGSSGASDPDRRFIEAISDASRYHAGQLRKGTEVPYLAHLLSVAALVIEAGGSENEAIAALLHDAVEDAGGKATLEEIRQHFGDEVAMIVEACSDTDITPKPPWKERKEAYLARLREPDTPDSVLRVSLGDKLHNARSILSDYGTLGDDLWERFKTKSAGDQLWYYGELAQIFSSRMPGPQSSELGRVVAELARLAAVPT
jgi:HD domain